MYPENSRERPDYYFQQSAVIPYRCAAGTIEVMLVTSRNKRRWIIPKGIVEPFMSAAESARKEAHEEAGIDGEVSPASVGAYAYEKWGGVCSVEVFTMRVTEEQPVWEESFRDRRWFSVPEAAALLKEPALKELVSALPATIGQHPNE
jgi:phosphohistidine phosphatase